MILISQYLLTLVLSIAMAILGSCRFQPLYIRNTANIITPVKIQVEPVGEHVGQMLRNSLTDHLSVAEPAHYALSVQLSISKQNISLQQEGSNNTRINLIIWALYHLKNLEDNKPLLKGRVHAITSYSIFEAKYTAVVSEYYAEKYAVQQLADSISRRLAIYFFSHS